MTTLGHSRSIPDIFSDVVLQFTTLLRKEGQLARSEISENIGRATAGLSLVIGGAVLLIPALVILFQAGVAALAPALGITAAASALIVGGIALVLGLIFLLVGMNRLKIKTMMPDKTIHQLQRDASVAKEQARHRHDLHRAA
ncbi:phage holin family protein [Mesorhizobium sp. M1050]|uniref:phage holin family protein n=1 Tax=unclassified Mesorhizobium TaxID=325217 RepID=UPI0003CF758B|nr:phage holin family protein [Mesorhizobium sp. LNHC252B00]ESY73921.1 hypothetical protein X743_10070 [Mesorhizobium sp. LNHC252B00]